MVNVRAMCCMLVLGFSVSKCAREGHSLLCYVITCVQRVFSMGAIYLLIWILGNPLSRKKINLHQILSIL